MSDDEQERLARVASPVRARWMDEHVRLAALLGWTIHDVDGSEDYQGWGALLLTRSDEIVDSNAESVVDDALTQAAEVESMFPAYAEALTRRAIEAAEHAASTIVVKRRWAVASWFYGSCSGCDAYEDSLSYEPADEIIVQVLSENLYEQPDEEVARIEFSKAKGW